MKAVYSRVALVVGLCALGLASVHASPAACASPCTIETSIAGYVAPANEIPNGGIVRWHGVPEESHPTADTNRSAESCFTVPVGEGASVRSVKFAITGGVLRATTDPGTQFARTQTCTSGASLGPGGYLLPYQCLLHVHMRGTLLIDA